MAPEILSSGAYSEQVDIYSFAMLLLELLVGDPCYATDQKHVPSPQRVFPISRTIVFSQVPSEAEGERLRELWRLAVRTYIREGDAGWPLYTDAVYPTHADLPSPSLCG